MRLNKTWFRLSLWLTACTVLLWRYYGDKGFGEIFTVGYIVEAHHVSPWGVLFLCLLFVILKRDKIKGDLQKKVSLIFAAIGFGIVCLSVFIPLVPDLIVLKSLLACLGFFTMFFGRAALLPAKLLSVYAFTVLMPIGVQAFLERPYALAAVVPAALVAKALGLPVTVNEQVLTFDTLSGETISIVVTAACAGPSTMAVFISIFALMMMDSRLPIKTAEVVFLFGVAGTWVQSVIRIIIIMASGHFGGAPALWKAHFWTIYVLFPLWYLIFAAIYFKFLDKASLRPVQCSPRRA